MAKVIDITDRLSFEESPKLVIKGQEIGVNTDAPTMLKIMGMMGDGTPGVQEVVGAYELIFSKEDRELLDSLHLSFNDLVTVIKSGIELIVRETEEKEQ